jgi:hypothetical protein
MSTKEAVYSPRSRATMYPGENHTCPVCGTLAWKRESAASCVLVHVLDKDGAPSEWSVVDVMEEDDDVFLTCERRHVWIARTCEVVSNGEHGK